MKMLPQFLFAIFIAIALSIGTLVLPAAADMYVSGQFGGVFPQGLTHVDHVTGSFQPGTTATSLSQMSSIMYGGKVGYLLADWLAIEMEAFNSTPHVKAQPQTFNEPTFGPFQQPNGGTLRMTTWAVGPVFRLPLTQRITAYAGASPAVFFSHFKQGGEAPRSSNSLGLNTQLGVSYRLVPGVSLFAEYKYNHARFIYSQVGTTEGFNASYNAHIGAVGITFWIPDQSIANLFGLTAKPVFDSTLKPLFE
ncbi:MAG: porin family protein [Nitrospirae bacterium]|nr:porin family protein [Nitrospirota bacterium]